MRIKMFRAIGALGAIATVVALGALTATDLRAQEPRPARGERLEALASEIGLTDAQVAEIRRIHTEGRKAARNSALDIWKC